MELHQRSRRTSLVDPEAGIGRSQFHIPAVNSETKKNTVKIKPIIELITNVGLLVIIQQQKYSVEQHSFVNPSSRPRNI